MSDAKGGDAEKKKKKKPKKIEDPMQKTREQEEAEIAALKADIEEEQKKHDSMTWNNNELEKQVRQMEANVIQLEAGNLEADDSEIKRKYDNQRQLNIQLAEQKRWLEHELEQIKLKIQNEKMNLLPDPFALDWDALSETEMKRLVGQLEKTRNDLRSDLREMEWRLDKEGREYHHYEDFCKLYRAEILNLNRMLDTLMRNGMLPANFQLPTGSLSNNTSASNSFPSTGHHTPGSPLKGAPQLPQGPGSPTLDRKFGGSTYGQKRDFYQPSSPTKRGRGKGAILPESPTKTIDPKLGPIRKTAGVRNLPKIDKKAISNGGMAGSRTGKSGSKKDKKGREKDQKEKEAMRLMNDQVPDPNEGLGKTDLKPEPLAPLSAGKKNSNEELDPVLEEAVNEE